MAQDILSDALNQMLNAKKAGIKIVRIKRHSKLLLSVLAIAKMKDYVKNYSVENNILTIELGKINKCQAIKPRFIVKTESIEKYSKRYLPAKDIGVIIVSTSKGLMSHTTALEKNLGGCLIAYFY
jgi:small subunit ribosomal protein S8